MGCNCVLEDEKVSLDELQETIAEFDDYVQSTDVAAMQSMLLQSMLMRRTLNLFNRIIEWCITMYPEICIELIRLEETTVYECAHLSFAIWLERNLLTGLECIRAGTH